MTLAELGAQLREERLALGLMVEDVAARLKVPSRILRAIEEGGVSELPHTVYTRGFIKGYGLILGYSNEKITGLLDSLVDFDDDFSPPKTLEARPLRAEDAPSGARTGLGLVLKLVVLAVLAGGAYLYYVHVFQQGESSISLPSFQSGAPVAETTPTPAPVVTPPPAPVATVTEAAEDAVEWVMEPQTSVSETPQASGSSVADVGNSGVPANPSGAAGSATSTPAPVVETPVVSPSAPAAQTAPVAVAEAPAPAEASTSTTPSPATAMPAGTVVAPSSPSAEPADSSVPAAESAPARPQGSSESASVFGTSTLPSSLPPGMQQIVLTAEAECWVHANADGTVTREFSLKAGETFAMPFKDNLVLKLGNAGGVRIKYNGVDMPNPGSSGQVKTVRFPPQN